MDNEARSRTIHPHTTDFKEGLAAAFRGTRDPISPGASHIRTHTERAQMSTELTFETIIYEVEGAHRHRITHEPSRCA